MLRVISILDNLPNELDGLFINNKTSNVTFVQPAFAVSVLQVEEGQTGNIQLKVGLTDDGQMTDDQVRLSTITQHTIGIYNLGQKKVCTDNRSNFENVIITLN